MTGGPTEADLAVLARLAATVAARRGAAGADSYTARLIADPELAARKLGEEAVETIVASLGADKGALAEEAADLVYHLLALLAAHGLGLGDVARALAAREGTSGLAEKRAR
jgi:phosphoribosyl-ATP pyrophosphohydrolase